MSTSRTSRLICNPLDLEYRYQDVRFSGSVGGIVIGEPRRSVHREAADPSIVRYRGRYYLFASMSRGFWHSVDLAQWTYQATEKLPPYDYAPDVRVVDDALIVCASRKSGTSPFFRSVSPLDDDFEEVAPGTFAFWDPNIFQDDDGRVYLYWGCGSTEPIRGVEVDADFTPIGEPVDLVAADARRRGWERNGEDHRIPEPTTERERRAAAFLSSDPYIEGAWMTRRGETYYLQYAAPGTQYNTYADGYLTSNSPLGPFLHSEESPFSLKAGGFITGAGHGSTVQDEYGNWWHAATMRISVNDIFERRIGIFPAAFDADGVLQCEQGFADYPMTVPDGPLPLASHAEPEWMLLSGGATARASSSAAGHEPLLATTEDVRTWWVSDGPGRDEWLEVDLGEPKDVRAVQVNLADHRLADFASELTEGHDQGHTWRSIYATHQEAEYTFEASTDGRSWTVLHDGVATPHALIQVVEREHLRYLRLRAHRLPFDGPLAVSGVRVFGVGSTEAPEVAAADCRRIDPLTAEVEWTPAERAQRYVVRYGTRPERLTRSRTVLNGTSVELAGLNAGTDLWIRVDAVNEGGVTQGTLVGPAAHLPQS
ncbi:family 43 glycosylhydrolase [Microbacterium sp. Leaf179]|uniref:family 43 glycosylhydrolase n=1 Tax=Microbacterium sp. Leaf179 TaxID=1736288 RepID=UPI0006F6C4BE|nr:family 43 glycosylhydrolase [Microbacterium sp. Leaf179]KQR89002.1 hypothetical protein ASF96_04435 [Microbacterium sp. Leaf179]